MLYIPYSAPLQSVYQAVRSLVYTLSFHIVASGRVIAAGVFIDAAGGFIL